MRGATWNRDSVILFSPGGGPLFSVAATGGEPTLVTKLDESRGERSHRWPQFLPDGRNFLYLIESANPENHGVYVGSLDGSVKKQLLWVETNAVYATPGYLFFAQESKLVAQAFDVQKIMLVGEPFPLNDLFAAVSDQQQAELLEINIQAAQMALSNSESGVMAYSQMNHNKAWLTWVDRQGKRLGVIEGDYRRPDISLDGKKVVFEGNAPQKTDGDVWMMDVSRGVPLQLTSHPTIDFSAIWAPDSSRIVFSSNHGTTWDLFVKAASGMGKVDLLYSSNRNKWPDDWSVDGRFLAFGSSGGLNGLDIWILPMEGERKAFPWIQTEFNELAAQFSPNGKWIAYTSDKSGSPQIYVRSFPREDGETQISAAGGAFPRWRRDGRELFYMSADAKLMAVEVHADNYFVAGVPHPLFEIDPPSITGPWGEFFAVSPDGQRFLVKTNEEHSSSTPVTILTNWATKLQKF